MSILSTNQRLINVGQDYSAGDNIGIYDYTISSRNWTPDITYASESAYQRATSYTDTQISGLSSNVESISGEVSYLSSVAITAHQSLDGYLTKASGDEYYQPIGNYLSSNALDGYATQDWVTAQGYITGVDLSEYAKRTDVLSSIESSTSGKLDVSSFASVSSDFLTNEDLNGYATESFVENVSGDITALIPTDYYPNTNPRGFISGVDLSNYYQKNETSSKQEISAAIAAIPLGDEEVNQVVHTNSSTWNDITAYQDNSASYITEHQSLNGLMSASLLEYSGSVITAYNGHKFAGELSGDLADTHVNEWVYNNSGKCEESNNVVETNSGTWNDVVNKLYISSYHELTAGTNIDIQNYVISSKDWTNDITQASSYAFSEATALIPTLTFHYVEI